MVWQRLSMAVVRKYGLQDLALRTFRLRLRQSEAAKLLADLEMIEEGVARATAADREG